MSVVFQLACDGSNGSTTFTDSSPSPKTVSVFGNAQVSTAQSKFGGASAAFDGTGDYLSVADSADWDIPGYCTVEFWFRTEVSSGVSFTKGIIGTGTLASSAGWAVGHYMGTLSLRINSTSYSGSGTINDATWYHVALVWNGASFKCYLDGAELYSGTAGAIDTSAALIVGNFSPIDANRYLQGYVDDIRVAKGEVIYSAPFTPPIVAHPSSWLAYVAGTGPLQQPSALGAPMVPGYVAATGPLGAAEIVARQPVAAHVSADGPLGSALVLGLHDFSVFVEGLATFYVMDMDTPGGTVRAPISSWQATLQTGSANYLQCVIPACAPYLDDINEATSFTVSRRAVLANGTVLEYAMASAPVDNTSISRGTSNYTAVLDGYGAALTADADPSTALDRTLRDVRTVFNQASGVRVRCGVDWLLRPAQRAYLGDTPFIVSYINYYVSDGDQYMDVGERIEEA